MDFYPIPTCSLNELIATKAAFSIREAELFCGSIQLDLSANGLIGVGAFKTTQSAQLALLPLRRSGIGSRSNHDIVLKRPYIDNNSEPGPPFTCYTLVDESNLLYREANVLYWAKALLKLTYDFIDHAINDASILPPFEIPRLHFIDAGLMLAYSFATITTHASEKTQSAKPGGGIVSTIYLAEELIPTSSEGKFVKYIHNGDAVPCDLFDAKADEIAEFLAFTQHVQYAKMDGQVYISDYQGMFFWHFNFVN